MHISLKSLIPKSYEFEPKTLGEHLLKRRLNLEMTQAEVGRQFSVTLATIFNWEKGKTIPQIMHMPALMKFLGYDPTSAIPNTIAEQLLFKRREVGWTQKMAARNLDVDPCTWSNWECGGTILSHKHRQMIASFLSMNEEIINEKMKKQWNERHGK